MPDRTTYHTLQEKSLLKYLSARRGTHLTAARIRDDFAAEGSPMGLATIYRHMDRLVRRGLARKYVLGTGDGACYEYLGEEERNECAAHFHCKCEGCGALIHLDCDELAAIREHLLAHHGFAWNSGRTVFYGLCERCQSTRPE